MASIPPGIPPFNAFQPPLPPGWTEHQAPTGHTYYFHAASGQSTYTRPIPNMPGGFVAPGAIVPGAAPPKEKKKKEKLAKTSIPGTPWLRVKTVDGNVFYTHKELKESVWEVPEEIKNAVEKLEDEEKEKEEMEAKKVKEEAERAEEEQKRREREEVERVKNEIKAAAASGKRKASEPAEEDNQTPPKKARVEEDEGSERDEGEDAEMADEAEAKSERATSQQPIVEKKSRTKIRKEEALKKTFNVPDRVDLSIDEAKALFITLLKEKNINPLHPWDTSLPLFINDPRYVLLPSVTARREAFHEYCRDTIRAQREAKREKEKEEAEQGVVAPKDKDKEAYAKLLKEEATSTRTTWTEFKRKWKKDRRFYGWAGDREREKAFRDWIKELADIKKKAAEKAERDFFQLLKEHTEIKPGDVWKEAKRKVDPKDPRYDAVGSSTLREELFNTYLKTLSEPSSKPSGDDASSSKPQPEVDPAQKRKERAERSLREREEKVRREREDLERQLGKTRGAVNREEGEREFMTLLTDAVRDPQATWDNTVQSLQKDPRFVLCALPLPAQRALFNNHITHLRERYLKMLHALFSAHSPSLNTTWDTLDDTARNAIRRSVPASKLGLYEDPYEDNTHDSDSEDGIIRKRRTDRADRELISEFERWQRMRNVDARKAFDDMLGENAFLEFWGRMSKAESGEEGTGIPGVEEEEGEEGEGGGGKADLKKLAKSIDIEEAATVLKNDSRWTAFDHIPEQQERWLRDHMGRLAAPKLSVHVPDKA